MRDVDLTQFKDVGVCIDESDIKSLKEDEYLLKVSGDTGFMTKLNANGSIPKAFHDWQYYSWSNGDRLPNNVIIEKFRRGWRLVTLRNGKSASFVVLRHPHGFTVEINKEAFTEIADKLTIVDGVIITPCYYDGKPKGSKLLVQEDDDAVQALKEFTVEMLGEQPWE